MSATVNVVTPTTKKERKDKTRENAFARALSSYKGDAKTLFKEMKTMMGSISDHIKNLVDTQRETMNILDEEKRRHADIWSQEEMKALEDPDAVGFCLMMAGFLQSCYDDDEKNDISGKTKQTVWKKCQMERILPVFIPKTMFKIDKVHDGGNPALSFEKLLQEKQESKTDFVPKERKVANGRKVVAKLEGKQLDEINLKTPCHMEIALEERKESLPASQQHRSTRKMTAEKLMESFLMTLSDVSDASTAKRIDIMQNEDDLTSSKTQGDDDSIDFIHVVSHLVLFYSFHPQCSR